MVDGSFDINSCMILFNILSIEDVRRLLCKIRITYAFSYRIGFIIICIDLGFKLR